MIDNKPKYLDKIEEARQMYNELAINKLLDDQEENKNRKEKLKKIFENEQEQSKGRK